MTIPAPIAYVRARPRGGPGDVSTYLAVRAAELPGLLAGTDGEMDLERCDLALPPDVANRLATELSSPIKRVIPIVGTGRRPAVAGKTARAGNR